VIAFLAYLLFKKQGSGDANSTMINVHQESKPTISSGGGGGMLGGMFDGIL
jgi:hypothetical protein